MNRSRRRALLAIPFAAVTVAATSVATVSAGNEARTGGVPGAGRDVSAAASVSLSNCATPRSDFITNDTTGLSTSSTTYVAVPGMTKVITQGAGAATCVLVVVSGFSFAVGDPGELEYVRVTLDGVPGNPIEVQWSGDDDEDGDGRWARQHAAVFAFRGVAAGNHVVAMQYRSFSGGPVFLHRPAMAIHHR